MELADQILYVCYDVDYSAVWDVVENQIAPLHAAASQLLADLQAEEA